VGILILSGTTGFGVLKFYRISNCLKRGAELSTLEVRYADFADAHSFTTNDRG